MLPASAGWRLAAPLSLGKCNAPQPTNMGERKVAAGEGKGWGCRTVLSRISAAVFCTGATDNGSK